MYFCCFFWFCVDNVGMSVSGEDFVNRVDSKLKELNLKRQVLADYCKFSIQTFTDWKRRDSIPSADIALKIANYLNVSVEWLITGEEGEIPQEILDLAYEINALPEVYKNFIKADLAKYKSACVSLDEEKISNSS